MKGMRSGGCSHSGPYTTFIREELGPSAPQQLHSIIDSAKQFLGSAITDNRSQIEALGEVSARVTVDSEPLTIIQTLVSELAKANSRASALELNFIETSDALEKVRVSLADAEHRSNTDALTGLANRRALDAFFRTAMIRAMEIDEPLSAFMIDIDHFKKFNDNHGHLMGDQVLRLVSRVLQDGIREGDLAARYGGEEIIAVLPGADLAACKEVAERLRRRISDAKLKMRSTVMSVIRICIQVDHA